MSVGFRLRCVGECAWSVLAAWLARCGRNMEGVSLPAVAHRDPPAEEDVRFVAAWADRATRILAARSGRRCFFRSFTLARVLRRAGMDVVLNVGLRAHGAWAQTDGHCWITTADNSPLFEGSLPSDYTVLLGNGAPGVRYWAGASIPADTKRAGKEG